MDIFSCVTGLLGRKLVKGLDLQVWAGHAVSLFNLAPCGISCLFYVYRFIQANLEKRARLWGTVRREIKMAASLVWLTGVNLGAEFVRQIDVGDSANKGYALLTGMFPLSTLQELWSYNEKWRY